MFFREAGPPTAPSLLLLHGFPTWTISRVVGTGNHIFVDSAVAATITGRAPTDVDADHCGMGRD